MASIDEEDVRQLLRAVFVAGGGTHDDFDEHDRVMAEEHRTVVLLRPGRIATPPHARHIEH